MERRTHIPRGYVAFTGKVLSDAAVAGYNDIQDQINSWIDAGRNPPAWLLDWSFRYFRNSAAL